MKKLLRSLTAILLSVLVALGCVACKPGGGESKQESETEESKVPQYAKRTEHFLYGVNYIETQMSDRLSTAQVSYMAMALGAQSVRISAYCLQTADTFQEDEKARIHGLLQSLNYSGVDQIVLQQAMLPLDGILGYYAPYPDLEDSEYLEYLDAVEAMASLLAEEFSEVGYWQIGHRLNDDRFLHPMGWKAENSPVDPFTVEEKAQITADVCFRVTRALRAAGSAAVVVLPDFVDYSSADTREYLNFLYDEITGGERGSAAVDEFFGILSWDAEFDRDPAEFADACNKLYDVVKAHGDDGRHVIISEIGFENGVSGAEAEWLTSVYTQAAALDYIESVQYYRLFTDGAEQYGLVKEPRAGFQATATGYKFYELTGSSADLDRYVIKEDQYSSGDNVAINVPTTASSSCEHPGWGWSLAGINNGTRNYSGWSNYYEYQTTPWADKLDGTGAPAPDYEEWVIFALPFVWEIDTVVMYQRNEVDEVFHQIYGLPEWTVIEVSDDGEHWTQVAELKVTPKTYPEGVETLDRADNPPLEIRFDAVKTRYVRVLFKTLRSAWQHSENAFFVQLEEIEILMH